MPHMTTKMCITTPMQFFSRTKEAPKSSTMLSSLARSSDEASFQSFEESENHWHTSLPFSVRRSKTFRGSSEHCTRLPVKCFSSVSQKYFVFSARLEIPEEEKNFYSRKFSFETISINSEKNFEIEAVLRLSHTIFIREKLFTYGACRTVTE